MDLSPSLVHFRVWSNDDNDDDDVIRNTISIITSRLCISFIFRTRWVHRRVLIARGKNDRLRLLASRQPPLSDTCLAVLITALGECFHTFSSA